MSRVGRRPGGAALLSMTLAAVLVAGAAAPPPTAPEGPWLEERAAQLGVDFVHHAGRTGRFYVPEIMGAGLALLDADGDGDLDLFLVQGGDLERPAAGEGHRLFRNQLVETGGLRFTDVTAASGLRGCAYGMGAAAGDYDNDGRTDLYVTCVGSNQLWHNEGNAADGSARFRDVTREANADDERWSVSAAFLDYDRDGWLDLYVGNYMQFSAAGYKHCRTRTGIADYCGPDSAPPQPGRLLHNRGNGTFEDTTSRAGLLAAYGPGLGVVTFDFDGDGWLDIYVANDRTENQLWINAHDGTFRDEGLLAGCALSAEAKPLASMGIDAGDYDGDGDFDLAMTNFIGEGVSLYRTDRVICEDASTLAGLRGPSLPYNGFGMAWLDVDNDGWLDLFAAYGAVTVLAEQHAAGDPLPFRQPKQLFRNLGNGRFEDATARGGPALAVAEVSRGAAFGDLDQDGDTDVVVSNNDGPVRLFLNGVGSRHRWLGLRLLTAAGRDALGAVVTLERDGAPPLVRHCHSDGSYASSNDPRVLFGLGDRDRARRVVVRWPSGRHETFNGVVAGRYTTLSEGSGASP